MVVLHDGAKLKADQLGCWEQQHGLVDPAPIWVDERRGLIKIRHEEGQLIAQEKLGEGPTKCSDEMNWNPLDEVGPASLLMGDGKGIAKPSITETHEQLALGSSDGVREATDLRCNNSCRSGDESAKKRSINIEGKMR